MRRIGFPRWNVGPRRAADGCGNWLFTCVISLLFLLLNVALIRAFYTTLTPFSPRLLREIRLAQAVAILGPIVLLLLEWWIVEFLADLLALRRARPAAKRRLARKH